MHRLLVAPVLLLAASVAPAAAAAPTDRDAPSVTSTTPSESVRVGAPVQARGTTDVEGRATDVGSGVRSVTVVFCPNGRADAGWSCGSDPVPGSIVTTPASVACSDAARLRCSWVAPVPVHPGRYLVLPRVVDRAGNVGRGEPVVVTVL